METKRRFSIKIRQLAKGNKTWECEVDFEGETMENTVLFSDKLVKILEQRYPIDPNPVPK